MQKQISELELDARQEDSLADGMDRAPVSSAASDSNAAPVSTAAAAKPAISSAALNAVTLRKDADRYRSEAARLRGELAGLDTLSAATSASAFAP